MTGPRSDANDGRSSDHERQGSTVYYRDLCATLATALEGCEPDGPVTTARLVGDLRAEIDRLIARGGSFVDVARTFEAHGVRTSPDAVRMALRRSGSHPSPVRTGASKPRKLARPRRAQVSSHAVPLDPPSAVRRPSDRRR